MDETKQPGWEQTTKYRELDIYEREVAAREREVAAKEGELKRSRWSNPVVIALLVGAFGLFGNAIVAFLNNRNAQQVERMRSQANLILEAIKTGSPEKACTNLVAILNVGLLDDDPAQTIRHNCQTSPSTGPYLPIGGVGGSTSFLTAGGTVWTTGATDVNLMINGIQGVVVDANSRQPIGNAIISAEDLEKVVTDGQGQFRLRVPPPRNRPTYTITAEKEGYRSGQAAWPAAGAYLVTIELHKK